MVLGATSKISRSGMSTVTNPAKPRRASAYVTDKEPVIVCEIDGTIVDTVEPKMRAKFLKKFLDLILNRIDVNARKTYYYEDLIEYKVATSDEITPDSIRKVYEETA